MEDPSGTTPKGDPPRTPRQSPPRTPPSRTSKVSPPAISPIVWLARRDSTSSVLPSPPLSPGIVKWKNDAKTPSPLRKAREKRYSAHIHKKKWSSIGSLRDLEGLPNVPSIASLRDLNSREDPLRKSSLSSTASERRCEFLTRALQCADEDIEYEVGRYGVLERTTDLLLEKYRASKRELNAAIAALERQKASENALRESAEKVEKEKKEATDAFAALECEMHIRRDAAQRMNASERSLEVEYAESMAREIAELKQKIRELQSEHILQKSSMDTLRNRSRRIKHEELQHKSAMSTCMREQRMQMSALESSLEAARKEAAESRARALDACRSESEISARCANLETRYCEYVHEQKRQETRAAKKLRASHQQLTSLEASLKAAKRNATMASHFKAMSRPAKGSDVVEPGRTLKRGPARGTMGPACTLATVMFRVRVYHAIAIFGLLMVLVCAPAAMIHFYDFSRIPDYHPH